MSTSGEYFLGGSEWAATRLRLQHELTKVNLDGHVLDPAIPPPKTGMVIADIGCGTGTWLLDAVDGVPDLVAEGLDINLDNVPPKAWLPDSVSFRQSNILEAAPEDLVEKYDVMNVQFMSSFIRDTQIEQVMAALVKMLKPGGYLQVTDADFNRWSWITATGNRKPSETVKFFKLVEDIFGGFGQWQWLQNIEQTFTKAGLEDIRCRRPQAKPSTLQGNMMNILLAQLEAGEMIAKHPQLSSRAAEQKEQRNKAAKEARELNVGMDLAVTRCCGRKPL